DQSLAILHFGRDTRTFRSFGEADERIAHVGMVRARVRLGLRYAAERYGDNVRPRPGPALQFAHPTLGMKASMLPSSRATERSPGDEGHRGIGVWRPLGP